MLLYRFKAVRYMCLPEINPGVMTQVEHSLEVLQMHEQKMSLVIATSG